MEYPRVWVVDSSPAIRETIAIVLAGTHQVDGFSPEEYRRTPPQWESVQLLIVGEDAIPTNELGALTNAPPVLWLHSRATPPAAGAHWAVLPRSFRPEELREAVAALLARHAQPPASPRISILSYPFVPREAALLAQRAVGTRFPVLLCGEPGTGKGRMARAIQSLGGEDRFVAVSAAGCTRAALEHAAAIAPGDVTLYISDVGTLGADAQQLLRDLLDCGGFSSKAGWHRVRIVGATAQRLEDLARARTLDTDLFYRLSVLPITLPPLRERTADIVVLASHIAADLAQTLALESPRLTKRAGDRLTHYLWFGNLAEMETVLARTIALQRGQIIDADDLLFGYGPIAALPGDHLGGSEAHATASSAPTSSAAVDLIVNELAHEFKNPMVTIKTVAQHLERLLEDESGREQVARLTGEAVDRMDRVLDNLLQFTRFRTPSPHEVTLNSLLASPLTELAPVLSERRVLLNYRPPEPQTHQVFVDVDQVGYAFGNLLRAITRDMQEGQTLAISSTEAATLRFDFNATGHTIADKLVKFIDHGHNGREAALPLGLVLAKSLIERNGGHIEIDHVNDNASITVSLPGREETLPENGQATSPHS